MEQDPLLPPGHVLFGEYEIVQQIGSGGMGRVYSARHRSMDELRAIKVVLRDLDDKQEALLIKEAKSLIRLNHNGVVRCHDLLRDEKRLYLVMEFVEGPSLQRILLQGPLPDDEVRTLRKRILESLAAIHAEGVVHRDISPANIIIPDGAPEKAKIVDFGLAGAEAADGRKGFKGNPLYASPEQFGLFGGKVEAGTDLYSLGLVLAEATIGERLPMGDTQNERTAFRKVRPSLPDYVPMELQREILPLLEPDPRKRPSSATDALTARASTQDVEKKKSVVPPGEDWLTSTVFLASAIGVGIGLGFTIWAWTYTKLLGEAFPQASPPPVLAVNPTNPSNPTPSPAIAPPARPPAKTVIVGNPQKPNPPPLPPPYQPPAGTPPAPGSITRALVMDVANRMVGLEWTPAQSNLQAHCKLQSPYKTQWRLNVAVKGIPYCWGGMDGPDEYNRKLQLGLTAGSHSWHGVAPCTAGIDCSGFVLFCWGIRGGHAYTTRSLNQIAPKLKIDVKKGLKPGDALNWSGKHVVMFGGYQPDGRPIIYEANGYYARVVRREDLTWAKLKKYHPVRYKLILD